MEIIKSNVDYTKKVSAPLYIYKTAKLRFIASVSSLLILTVIASYY
jgi:hypothetical protein